MPSTAKVYQPLVDHYERTLALHGDSHLGVDWPNPTDAATRYRVHLDVIDPAASRPVELLDLGCGASHMLDYLIANHRDGVVYSGLDISPRFVELSTSKHPNVRYYCLDVLEDDSSLPMFDYVVMNGVLTEKRELSFEEMLAFAKAMIAKALAHARVAVSFNVMSKHVDWERDDLFHLPFDTLAAFLTAQVSRSFVIRNDYGLYEYTTYVYR